MSDVVTGLLMLYICGAILRAAWEIYWAIGPIDPLELARLSLRWPLAMFDD